MTSASGRPSILFLAPRTDLIARRPALKKLWKQNENFRHSSFFAPLPNLGLLTLAGHTPEGYGRTYWDENVESGLPAGPFSIVAISAMTCQSARAYELAAHYRRLGSHVVMGGAHASILPDEAAGHADTIIRGEAEELWPRFLDDFRKGHPEKMYQAKAGAFDLSKAKRPTYELVPPDRYRVMPVQIGRGCPLGCEFCSVEAIHGRRYRRKTLTQVLDEIRFIRSLRPKGRQRIFFTDDNLYLHRDFLRELLPELPALKINWMAQVDISIAKDAGLLRLMADSGCTQVLVGFESLERSNLEHLQPHGVKPKHVDQYGPMIRTIQSFGIRVLGMFIVGLDHDRPPVFNKLAAFIEENMLDDAQVTIQTPLPGTRLFERLRAEQRLLEPVDWSRCNFFHVLFKPLHMTPRQLMNGQSRIYRLIYSPERMARKRAYWLELLRSQRSN